MIAHPQALNNYKTALDVVENCSLVGKVFVVTGAYSGLGAATCQALLSAGGTVIMTGRDGQALSNFAKKLAQRLSNSSPLFRPDRIFSEWTMDLSNLSTVPPFAERVSNRFSHIDCLINNAGIMNTPAALTIDGFESQFGVNVVGHFLLSKLLAQKTKRQVWLSSKGHNLVGPPPNGHDNQNAPSIDLERIRKIDTYDGWFRYQQSKLAVILLAKHFPLVFPDLDACAVDPGVARTKLTRHMSLPDILPFAVSMLMGRSEMATSPIKAATTQVHCATMPQNSFVNGALYAACEPIETATAAQSSADAQRLYEHLDNALQTFQ